MVVMAFDEEGQATTYERKIAICERAYRLLTQEAGVAPEDIIFDVNILSIGTGIEEHAKYAVDFIEAVRWIKANLPGALTSGGVSNLSFAFRGNNAVREAMHSAFLYHAIKAGLDMAIVNPSMLQIYDETEPELLKCVEDVIFDTDAHATERLIDKAARMKEEASAKPEVHDEHDHHCSCGHCHDHSDTTTSRLKTALIKGRTETLRQDLEEAIKEYGSAVGIIEGPLMEGMEAVGKLFGEGKMFLPQVVKSAKVMRDAVEILQPYMDSAADTVESARPKIVIATVKGDVHDIGKNITGIVLSCNGFDIHDLGVMVDKETILSEADRIGADIIAVSGLITPSLYQMEELCREMKSRGMNTPLFIGGATTSALHTAVKLAPLYEHVFYGADASAAAVLANR
jgi:5-methyltetrahydrofolate--homocysteine methyltransferase